ncbi:nitrogen regulation protein NR, partial [Vibrio parahaemolyticus]|nr:nitrogen regulation protein NR [Vibrio parahaemolyticus]
IAVHAKRSGKLIASTSPITVHLHRASVKPTVKGQNRKSE